MAQSARSDLIPASRMAMWWLLASEAVIFGGLVACYLLLRNHHPEWGASASHTLDAAGAANTFVLLTSSFIVVLAHQAAHNKQYQKASRLLFATVGFGLVFLCVKSYEYYHEVSAGFTPVTNVFWSFYYLMTGLHAAHVIAGMVAITVVAAQVRRGENAHRVEYVGMYWHLVDIVWIFLFPLLYMAS